MGSATSKNTQVVRSEGDGRRTPEPTVVRGTDNGIDTTVGSYPGYINVRSKSDDCVNTTDSGCNATLSGPKRPSDDKDVNNRHIINAKNSDFKFKIEWGKHSRRDSRLRTREKCLVGLENYRRTASPQLLMASKENYGRIKDAADLLRMQPSDTDVIGGLKANVVGPLDFDDDDDFYGNVTNKNIFREVSDNTNKLQDLSAPEKGDKNLKASEKTVHEMFRSTRTSSRDSPAGTKKTPSPKAKTSSPPWLKSSHSPPRKQQEEFGNKSPRILSRDNSRDRCQAGHDDFLGPPLAPLRYGKLGLQGGAIRKELEKEGIISTGTDSNPDVTLRELRHMWQVRQTTNGTSNTLQEEEQAPPVIMSRLPPIDKEALVRQLEEKKQRQAGRVEKIENERVNKFKERHKSRRHQEGGEEEGLSSYSEEETERLKLKMMDIELI